MRVATTICLFSSLAVVLITAVLTIPIESYIRHLNYYRRLYEDTNPSTRQKHLELVSLLISPLLRGHACPHLAPFTNSTLALSSGVDNIYYPSLL
jgi:hypothetical protein